MIKLIIGDNAIGKTMYINSLVSKFGLNSIITNMRDPKYLDSTPYNDDRLEVLQELVLADGITKSKSQLALYNTDSDLSSEFIQLLTIMCKDKKIMILDEPDKKIAYEELSQLITFLSFTERTYDSVYITTHYEGMLDLPKKEIFTLYKRDDGEILLKEISEDEAYEVII